MDFKKKYNDTLEMAKKLKAEFRGYNSNVAIIEQIFPELAESEDERIRKAIRLILIATEEDQDAFYRTHNLTRKECTDWLEKQKDILQERAQNITANMLEDRIEGIQHELIEFLSNTINASWVDIIKSADSYAERIKNIIEKQKGQKSIEDAAKEATKDKKSAEKFLKTTGIMDENGNLAEIYRSEKEPKDDKAFEEWIDDWYQGSKEAGGDVVMSESEFKNWSRGIRNMCQRKSVEIHPAEIHIETPNVEKFDPNVKITTSDSSADGKELLYVCNKSYHIGFRDGVASVKPIEWSKEDICILEDAITAVDLLGNDKEYSEKHPNLVKAFMTAKYWLKSLQEKFNLQPKQEWNEEDKRNLLDVKCIIDEVWHNQDIKEAIDYSGEELGTLWHWLDNIWQKVEYPQTHWKPSEEQMKAVFDASETNDKLSSVLSTLYNDLKKL